MTAAATAPAMLVPVVTKPGIYDLPADIYHADPVPDGSLSQSAAKLLLPPNCPAKFKWDLDHPADAEPKDHFDFGSAAHRTVLSDGAAIAEIGFPDRRTNAAKAAIAAAREAGQIPVLTKDLARVNAMAEAIKDHPVAYRLLSSGTPERSLFAIDPDTGVWLRARPDVLQPAGLNRLIIPDYKTADKADRDSFEKAAYNNGYLLQAVWYPRVAELIKLATDAVMLFVAQEKTAPYLVNVVELTTIALEYGRMLMADAIRTYATCRRTNYWPGYSTDIELIGLPRWAEREFLETR